MLRDDLVSMKGKREKKTNFKKIGHFDIKFDSLYNDLSHSSVSSDIFAYLIF